MDKVFTIRTLAAAALIAVAPVVSAQQPNASLAGVASNTWVSVDTGGMTSNANIMSYSGGWYDPVNHQFCIFGGGHWDYSGNEVWCFDISSETWVRLYAPDVIRTQSQSESGNKGDYANYNNSQYPGALFSPAGEPIANARPMSKHTYDQMEFVDGLGPIVYGGYSWGDGTSALGWCDICYDTWAFNFSTASWLYLYDGSNPAPDDQAGEGASAYSTQEGLLYVQSRSETWTYDPRTNNWNELSTSGNVPYFIHATMEYDPNRNVFYLFGGNYYANGRDEVDQMNLFRFEPVTRKWTQLNPSGPAPSTSTIESRGPGMGFDTYNDVLVIFRSGHIYVYDPDTNQWSKPTKPGNAPSNNNGIFGRFRFDPVNNGFWYLDYSRNTWFYRYQTTSFTPAPVISVIVDPPTLQSTSTINVKWAASNASACTASGNWSGSKTATGTETINVGGSSATFNLSCTGAGGSADRSVSISNNGIGGGGSGTCTNGCTGGGASGGGGGGSGGGSGGGGGGSNNPDAGDTDTEIFDDEGGGAIHLFGLFALTMVFAARRRRYYR